LTRLTGASNAGGVGRNCDYEPTYGFIACCQCFDRLVVINTVQSVRVVPWQIVTLIAGSKWRSLLMAGDNN